MTQITDRDAADPQALASDVLLYLLADDSSCEADIALEASLMEQGVINTDEVIDQMTREFFGVVVRLEDGTMFAVDTFGKVFIRAE
jgi:hypothetical protein